MLDHQWPGVGVGRPDGGGGGWVRVVRKRVIASARKEWRTENREIKRWAHCGGVCAEGGGWGREEGGYYLSKRIW